LGDIRDEIFGSLAGTRVTASIIADGDGVLAGASSAAEAAEELGLRLEAMLADGDDIAAGDEIARFSGTPKQMAVAEDTLMGFMAKPSGIAAAARGFVSETGNKPRVVCGAWKKMPKVLKGALRRAVVIGGASCRISSEPFLYLDKNYTRMFGGIRETLDAVADMKGYLKVVQLKGRHKDIVSEASEAVLSGASILFIDTGRLEDVGAVVGALAERGQRGGVEIAFGGGVGLEQVAELMDLDVDILDIGRNILDAPLLDMRFEIVAVDHSEQRGREDDAV
jgi:nicotinate-nucleotide pyrophosphorylase (carboxylating)